MKILYIGRFTIPKDAASFRVLSIARALSVNGHCVEFLCKEEYSEYDKDYEGFKYRYAFKKQENKFKVFNEWCTGTHTCKIVSTLFNKTHFDAVILYNSTIIESLKILKICNKHRVSLFSDVTEWYEIGHGKSIMASIYAGLVAARLHFLDQKFDGIIAISEYLKNYYLKRNINVIKVPPLFCYDQINTLQQENEMFTLFYAGSPGTKDEINIIIKAVERINESNNKNIKLVFVGAKKPSNLEIRSKNNIIFLPRCSNEEVVSNLKNVDFTFLLRRNARFAKAGYSTKLAESLYNGVPVICNSVGGADLDIKDGFNGIKIPDLSQDSIDEALKKANSLNRIQLKKIKENCFSFGKQNYYFKNYANDLACFICDKKVKI